MTLNPSVSVIVPFYNETAFLATAVQSVLSQGLDDFEIIIVNDNPDLFKDDDFEAFDFPDTVRVVHHKKNRGLPSSRNTGIDAATKDHVAFLDADDYYLPQGLQKHLMFAAQQGADITHAQTVITHVNRVSGYVIAPDAAYLNAKATGRYLGEDVIEAGFAIESSWASIYRKSFLRDKPVRFDESQVKFEDRIFVVEALTAADSLAIFGQPCRVWRKRNDSITTSSKSFDDQMLKVNLLRKSIDAWFKKTESNSRYWAMRELVRQVNYMITRNETSPWYNAFGFSDDADALEITRHLSEFFQSLDIKEADIIAAFDARSPRYAMGETGGGRITPHDLFRFIDAVARQDYQQARDVVNATVNRHQRGKLAPRMRVEQSEPVEILFHFGLHKTGTTHIQYQLEHNRKVLQQHGVLFPKTGFGFAPGLTPVRPMGLPGHQALVTSIFQTGGDLVPQLKGEILGSQCKKVIISAENLSQPSGGYMPRAKRARKVVEALGELGAVKPIFTYRRPDSWMESYYRELCGNGSGLAHQTPGEFLVNNKSYLNLGDIVGAVEEACEDTAILMSFEDLLDNYDDLVFGFLNKCGIEIPAKEFTLTEGTRYPSPCDAQLHVARMASLLVADQETRQNVLRTFYGMVEETGQKTRLFSERERADIIKTFCGFAADIFAKHGVPNPQEEWLAQVKPSNNNEPVQVPMAYMDALCTAGVMNGTGIKPAQLQESETLEPTDVEHLKLVNPHDLERLSHDKEHADYMAHVLNYMQNSVSWKVTSPLRRALKAYKDMRGIDTSGYIP